MNKKERKPRKHKRYPRKKRNPLKPKEPMLWDKPPSFPIIYASPGAILGLFIDLMVGTSERRTQQPSKPALEETNAIPVTFEVIE